MQSLQQVPKVGIYTVRHVIRKPEARGCENIFIDFFNSRRRPGGAKNSRGAKNTGMDD